MIRDYHFSLDYVLHGLPFAQGLALCAWAVENNEHLSVERASPGYIAQQIQKQVNA